MLTLFLVPARWCKLVWPLLAVWLVYEIALAKVPVEEKHPQQPIQQALPLTQGVPLKDFDGVYTPDHHPAATNIAGNGYGWEPETGFAADVVWLAVDRPEFVELRVSKRRALNGEKASNDVYQAQIDGISLPLQGVEHQEDGLTVTFDVPNAIQKYYGNTVLFLCFSSGYSVEDRDSERFLLSVRWR